MRPEAARSQLRESINLMLKVWVRNEAQRLLEANFKESLGSRHPALTILRYKAYYWKLNFTFDPVCSCVVG